MHILLFLFVFFVFLMGLLNSKIIGSYAANADNFVDMRLMLTVLLVKISVMD